MDATNRRHLLGFLRDPYDVLNNIGLVRWVSGLPITHMYAGLHASSIPFPERLERLTRKPLPTDKFRQMDPGTLGREFIEWYADHGLEWSHMATTAYDLSQHGSWPIARFGKLHDLHHVVTGIPPTRLGEIELQGLILGSGHPDFFSVLNVLLLPFLAVKAGSLTEGVLAFLRGVQRGRGCEDLLLFPYEDYWEFTLSGVRDLLGLPHPGV